MKTKKIKQEWKEINGMFYNICPDCQKPIEYPNGIRLSNKIEIHISCMQNRRELWYLKRGISSNV